ncbi:unnamed protein product [Ilex paraguariensis]|uniref:F-box domain-containing protein n=1 Tax=Ilex paraguariensis TaxID=185542 RepID=A0ABC8RU30_9AQUA
MERTVDAHSTHAKLQKGDNYLEEDRISQLPDGILITILHQLSFLEVPSTCVLSKRWKYLWMHAGDLNFSVPKKLLAIRKERTLVKVEMAKYISWVNRVLQLLDGAFINEFKVNFGLDSRDNCDIDEWISFAFGKKVQRLELDLKGAGYQYLPSHANRYHFPHEVYSHIRSPYGLPCIRFLTHLSLKFVTVAAEVVEHFLSNCPLLERLFVHGSPHLVNLRVVGPTLHLKFPEISRCDYLASLEIDAPNLVDRVVQEGETPLITKIKWEAQKLPSCGASEGSGNNLLSKERIRENIRRPAKCLHKCLEVVDFVGNIDIELAKYFIENAIALQKIIVDCRGPLFREWTEFKETKWAKESRMLALELKRELPQGVELVIHPEAEGIEDQRPQLFITNLFGISSIVETVDERLSEAEALIDVEVLAPLVEELELLQTYLEDCRTCINDCAVDLVA